MTTGVTVADAVAVIKVGAGSDTSNQGNEVARHAAAAVSAAVGRQQVGCDAPARMGTLSDRAGLSALAEMRFAVR